jgi:hypothetical protein
LAVRNGENGLFVDSFRQPLFKNEGLKVSGARVGVTGLPVTNVDNLYISR